MENRNFKLGSTTCRWIEDPQGEIGARFVGYADEVSRSIRHRGWYLDDDFQDETARGIVYRLPHGRYIYGIADPYNDGPAIIALEATCDETAAARWADQLAERYAEDERFYRAANNAGFHYGELGEDIANTRRACLALFAELKRYKPDCAQFPAIVEALRNSIETKLADIRDARRERAQLLNDFGHSQAFTDA